MTLTRQQRAALEMMSKPLAAELRERGASMLVFDSAIYPDSKVEIVIAECSCGANAQVVTTPDSASRFSGLACIECGAVN